MSWRRAPLYVEVHELCRWVIERRADCAQDLLLDRLCTESLELLGSIASALSFPGRRGLALERADETVARLRVFVRLAAELDLIRPNGGRHLAAILDRIGRMIGGWSRSQTASA